MATFADGKIEAYVGPTELGGTDNLELLGSYASPPDGQADRGDPKS